MTQGIMIAGKVEQVIVSQNGEHRCIKCVGCLKSCQREIGLLEVGIAGRPLIIADFDNTTVSDEEKRFSASFELNEGEALPVSLYSLAHCESGVTLALEFPISQSVVMFEEAVTCPSILLEANARRLEVEYRAFVDRSDPLIFSEIKSPKLSVILTHGTKQQYFSALTNLVSATTPQLEVFIPDDGEGMELFSLLQGIRFYDVKSGYLCGLNQALREVSAPFVLLLDPRARLLTGAYSIAESALQCDDLNVAVCGREIRSDGFLYAAGSVLDKSGKVVNFGTGCQAGGWEYLYEHDSEALSPMVSFYKCSILQELLFDENLSDYGAACLKLSNLIHNLGNRIIYHPDLVSAITLCADSTEKESEVVVGDHVCSESERSGFVVPESPLTEIVQTSRTSLLDEVTVETDLSSFPHVVTSHKLNVLVVLGQLSEEINPRLHDIFESLVKDGFSVTAFAMRGISCTLAQLRHSLLASIQYVDGESVQLQEFLDKNLKAYNLILVWQVPYLRKVLEISAKMTMPVICDVSGRECFSEMERNLLRSSSAVWVSNKKESNRLRNLGIVNHEIVSFSDESYGHESLLALVPALQNRLVPVEIE